MKRIAIALIALYLVSGCVRSTQPIYTDDTLTYDPSFLGTWYEPEGDRVTLAAQEDGRSYGIEYVAQKGSSTKLLGHLTKLGEWLVLDVTADPKSLPDNDVYAAHLLPLHSMYFIKREADGLEMRMIDESWLKGYLIDHPDAIPHLNASSTEESPTLSGSTEQLRAFVTKIAAIPNALSTPIIWTTHPPTTAPATQPAGGVEKS